MRAARLPRLRLGEYLAGLWLLMAGGVALVAAHWRGRFVFGATHYFPLVHVLLLMTTLSLGQLVLVSARGIALTASSFGRASGPGFEAERELLRRILRFARDCVPLYTLLLLYPTSDTMLDALQRSRLADPQLIRIDEVLFGGHASVWMQRFITPALTDVLSLCYFLHVVLPAIVMVAVSLLAPRRLFVEMIEAFVFVSIVGATLYVLVPAVGPLHSLRHLYTRDLGGGVITAVNRVAIQATRVPRDAFPSLHVAISALLLVYAWRTRRWLGALVALPTFGNWVSTLYLRYHYLIDVVAGFALVPLAIGVVRAWTRRFGDDSLQRPPLTAVPPAT